MSRPPLIFAVSRAEQAFQDSYVVLTATQAAYSAAEGSRPWLAPVATASIPYAQHHVARARRVAGQCHGTALQDGVADAAHIGKRLATGQPPPATVPRNGLTCRAAPPGVAGAFRGHNAMRASWDASHTWPDHATALFVPPCILVPRRRT